jgi:hypothetical protein
LFGLDQPRITTEVEDVFGITTVTWLIDFGGSTAECGEGQRCAGD